MKRLAVSLGLAMVVALVVCGAAVAGPYDFTSGAGKSVGGYSFDFTAHNNSQGQSDSLCPITLLTTGCSVGQSAVGQMHITDNGSGASGVADVNCLRVVTNTASIIGTIVRGDAPEFAPNAELVFFVQDGDSGSEAGPGDMFANPGVGPTGSAPCGTALPMFPLVSGNIVVVQGMP
jgi:hypothetical protein